MRTLRASYPGMGSGYTLHVCAHSLFSSFYFSFPRCHNADVYPHGPGLPDTHDLSLESAANAHMGAGDDEESGARLQNRNSYAFDSNMYVCRLFFITLSQLTIATRTSNTGAETQQLALGLEVKPTKSIMRHCQSIAIPRRSPPTFSRRTSVSNLI